MTEYAEVDYTEAENDDGRTQDCVFATCQASGDQAGPVWGHGENSVLRVLATLTEECSCGADFHEGVAISGERDDEDG